MTRAQDEPRRGGRIAEPVQVYLKLPDQERLARLMDRLHATKSDVLRLGLQALEAQTTASATPAAATPLPTFAGDGLLPGAVLDGNAALRDRMDDPDDAEDGAPA